MTQPTPAQSAKSLLQEYAAEVTKTSGRAGLAAAAAPKRPAPEPRARRKSRFDHAHPGDREGRAGLGDNAGRQPYQARTRRHHPARPPRGRAGRRGGERPRRRAGRSRGGRRGDLALRHLAHRGRRGFGHG